MERRHRHRLHHPRAGRSAQAADVLVPEGEPGLTQPAGASDSPGSAPATSADGGVLVKNTGALAFGKDVMENIVVFW